MSPANVARLRTALPQAWGAILILVLRNTGVVLDDLATEVVVAAVPIAGGLVYDLARRLESWGWARTARALLGSSRQPKYPTIPPQSLY